MAMVTANAEVNKMLLSHVYEKYEGSDRYINVRQISGCENMTMEEIDTVYREYKAEKKNRETKATERKAEREVRMAVASVRRAEKIAKSAKENPLGLWTLKNWEINTKKDFQWSTEYVCLNEWDPYGIAFAKGAK